METFPSRFPRTQVTPAVLKLKDSVSHVSHDITITLTCRNLPLVVARQRPSATPAPWKRLCSRWLYFKASGPYLRLMETVLFGFRWPFPRQGPFPVGRHRDGSPWETFPFKMVVLKLRLVRLRPRKTFPRAPRRCCRTWNRFPLVWLYLSHSSCS